MKMWGGSVQGVLTVSKVTEVVRGIYSMHSSQSQKGEHTCGKGKFADLMTEGAKVLGQ